MAKYLQVPLVYARKQRSVVMADTFDAGYNSKTIGQDQQLLVSRDHIDEDDRVLIIDDFLSSGSSQEAYYESFQRLVPRLSELVYCWRKNMRLVENHYQDMKYQLSQ